MSLWHISDPQQCIHIFITHHQPLLQTPGFIFQKYSILVLVLFPGVPSVGAMGAPLGPDLPDWLCADHHYHCHGETPLCCQVKTYFCKPWYMWRMIMFFILQADWCYYLYLYTVTECVELHQKHLFSFYGLNNDYCQENSSWMTQQKFHTQCQCQRHDTLCPSKALQSFNV